MRSLGFERLAVVSHDRGGRVAHRVALDFPERVTRLAVLDIVPTCTVFQTIARQRATGDFHWFFLIQPDELPERLIGAQPEVLPALDLGPLERHAGCAGSGGVRRVPAASCPR